MAARDEDDILLSPAARRLCRTASELRKLRYISVCIGVNLQTTTLNKVENETLLGAKWTKTDTNLWLISISEYRDKIRQMGTD